ncbi:uncharacterized protein LOC121525757 isoform X3 [Cheilinus undulatus]|uniref:uncharacterized protein LOC121525757 isoform X3 n=1 Tax=Cheilinus undulatus TaxID=241271 RepID=UPI001BD52C0E|nr:uncharacterized protein LOC121525757 isoform X3 [Cheilinus undulatus]
MSSTENLREFIIERLTAAAEDIFGVFQRTIFEYEAEIDRQRRLLDIVWQPHVNLHRIDVPQQHECKDEEVVADQQPCDQERKFSLDQEEPEPPQIKEEQEELCSSQRGEEPIVKQETETVMLTPTNEENDQTEPEQQHEQQLLSHTSHVTENQDPKESKHMDSESRGTSEPTQKMSHINMGIKRRSLWLTSSSVTRRGTSVQIKKSQNLHRLRRNRRNSASFRRERSS